MLALRDASLGQLEAAPAAIAEVAGCDYLHDRLDDERLCRADRTTTRYTSPLVLTRVSACGLFFAHSLRRAHNHRHHRSNMYSTSRVLHACGLRQPGLRTGKHYRPCKLPWNREIRIEQFSCSLTTNQSSSGHVDYAGRADKFSIPRGQGSCFRAFVDSVEQRPILPFNFDRYCPSSSHWCNVLL